MNCGLRIVDFRRGGSAVGEALLERGEPGTGFQI